MQKMFEEDICRKKTEETKQEELLLVKNIETTSIRKCLLTKEAYVVKGLNLSQERLENA